MEPKIPPLATSNGYPGAPTATFLEFLDSNRSRIIQFKRWHGSLDPKVARKKCSALGKKCYPRHEIRNDLLNSSELPSQECAGWPRSLTILLAPLQGPRGRQHIPQTRRGKHRAEVTGAWLEVLRTQEVAGGSPRSSYSSSYTMIIIIFQITLYKL